jgi:hypothetical protein
MRSAGTIGANTSYSAVVQPDFSADQLLLAAVSVSLTAARTAAAVRFPRVLPNSSGVPGGLPGTCRTHSWQPWCAAAQLLYHTFQPSVAACECIGVWLQKLGLPVPVALMLSSKQCTISSFVKHTVTKLVQAGAHIGAYR